MARSSIGIDIGHKYTKLIELRRRHRHLLVHRLITAETPGGCLTNGRVGDEEKLTAFLEQLLRASKFSGRDAILGLASADILVRSVDFPLMPRKELEQAIEFSLGDLVSFPFASPQEVSYSFDVITRTDSGQEILFAACRRSLIDPYIRVCRQAGFRLQGIDLQLLALPPMFQALRLTETSHVGIVDIGYTHTQIYIEDNGMYKVYRFLPVGGRHLIEGVVDSYQVSASEAEEILRQRHIDTVLAEGKGPVRAAVQQLIGGILQTFDFYRAQERVSSISEALGKIVITGGAVLVEGMLQLLSEELGMTVDAINPFAVMQAASDSEIPPENSLFLPACGLAWRGLVDR